MEMVCVVILGILKENRMPTYSEVRRGSVSIWQARRDGYAFGFEVIWSTRFYDFDTECSECFWATNCGNFNWFEVPTVVNSVDLHPEFCYDAFGRIPPRTSCPIGINSLDATIVGWTSCMFSRLPRLLRHSTDTVRHFVLRCVARRDSVGGICARLLRVRNFALYESRAVCYPVSGDARPSF